MLPQVLFFGVPMFRPLLAVPLAVALSGCAVPVEPPEDACPVVASRDWSAFVNAMPGPNRRPELIVSGTVTLPSAGYTVTLRPGAADRALPPVQFVELVAIPPAGPAATVLTETDVRLSMPAPAVDPGGPAAYRGVRVLCGSSELAFIAPVETAW
jgi:hypothetical protein